MNYQSYNDMANVIRRNLWKVPADVSLIVGVPRSGMIAALMIAELLNKPCASLCPSGFISMSRGGTREMMSHSQQYGKILLVEDVVNTGDSMARALQAFRDHHPGGYPQALTLAVYAEGINAKQMVDIYLQDNYRADDPDWFYEWNLLHHSKSDRCIWDIDGLLCKNPPDDRDTAAYEQYISDPVPMVIPTYKVGAFVTYRLEQYRPITEAWLKNHGIKYGQLCMFPAPDRKTRNDKMSPAFFKADLYDCSPNMLLFIESDPMQASLIHDISGKPVYCYESGIMYK